MRALRQGCVKTSMMSLVLGGARKGVVLACLVFGLGSCGRIDPDTGYELLDTNQGSGSTPEGQLRDTELTVSAATITPSNVPSCDAGVDELVITSKVTFTVKLNRSLQYNRINWGVRLLSPVGSGNDARIYRAKSSERNFDVSVDGVSPLAETRAISDTVSGDMEFRVKLASDEWEVVCKLAGKGEKDKRTSIIVQLFYSIRETIGSGDPDGTVILDLIRMQNDVGRIKSAADIVVRGTSSGAVTLELKGPSDLEAELPSENYGNIGPSQLSGYLVMYWKEGDCDAASWTFLTNPQTRIDPVTPDPTVSCQYPGLDAMTSQTGSCPFGCATEPQPGLHPRDGAAPSAESVAVPLESAACYRTVVLAPGRKTVGISGLENNARYGFVAWPLDSSATPGAARTSCVSALPLKIPMASSGDTGSSVRDCFVATAASGDPGSLTVHYWRLIRDRILDPLRVSDVYYRHGPRWAAWLEEHPALKAPVNAVLLVSGRSIVAIDEWTSSLRHRLHDGARALWGRLARLWARLSVQLSITGFAAETDAPQQPGSKALRSAEAIESEVSEQKPTKALLPAEPDRAKAPGGGAAPELTPSKQLPPAGSLGQGESSSAAPTKTLPPPSNLPGDHDAKEPRVYPEGSGGATTRLSGGVFIPSDSKLWKAYYSEGSPARVAVQQTFRVADIMGEWGLGFLGSIQFHSGKVPKTLPGGSPAAESVRGRKIGYYSTGFYLTTDYRWRYLPAPPVSLRLSLSGGGERLRETASEPVAESTSESDSDGSRGKFGYTLLKPMALVGGALEFSLGALFGNGFSSALLGYGGRDILLAADGVLSFDFSDHAFSQSGTLLGGSIVFVLE